MSYIYEEELPQWYKEEKCKHMVLTDDIDSLLSCAILKLVHPEWKIEYFFDFSTLYHSTLLELFDGIKLKDRVWVDCAVQNDEMAFDNHISLANKNTYRNPNMINPNFWLESYVAANYNYTDKYCGSTALMLWSLFNLPIPETEEGQMILMAIDSSYKGLISKNRHFMEQNYFYMDCIFDQDELVHMCFRHTNAEFETIKNKYKLHEKIQIIDGKLSLDMDLELLSSLLGIPIELPTDTFYVAEKYETHEIELKPHQINKLMNYKDKGIVSAAFGHKKKLKFTLRR